MCIDESSDCNVVTHQTDGCVCIDALEVDRHMTEVDGVMFGIDPDCEWNLQSKNMVLINKVERRNRCF